MKILRQNKKREDLELVKLYQQSLNSVFLGELFTRYSSFAIAVCMKYLKDEEKCKDTVMDIFEKLAEDLKTQEISFFKSWLYTVTRNHCLMILRSDKSKHKHLENIMHEQESYMENPEPLHQNNEDVLLNRTKIVAEALDSLKEDQQNCIKLFYYEEKSYQAIVDITGMELKKVKSHLQNGKRNLQILLNEEYKKMND